jgi:hypothetical protein
LDLQARINRLLTQEYVGEFKAQLIPSLARAPEFHRRLNELLMKRNRVEAGLENLLTDQAADGTPLDPTRDSEPEYQRLSALVNRTNISMLRIYAEYLGANAAYILDRDSVPSRRKRPADDAGMASPNQLRSPRHESVASAAPAPEGGATDTTPPCPYGHAKDQPVPSPTIPQLDTIVLSDTGNKALLVHVPLRASPQGIPAIADTGATHILLREEDSFLLSQVKYCQRHLKSRQRIQAQRNWTR